MELDLFDSGDGGKYNTAGFVGISTISAMQDTFFFGTEPFNRVWKEHCKCCELLHLTEWPVNANESESPRLQYSFTEEGCENSSSG